MVASALGCAAEVWRNASIVTGAGDETRAAAARVSGESGALGRSVLGALVDVVEGVSR